MSSTSLTARAEEYARSSWKTVEQTFSVHAPATGETLGEVPDCGPREAEHAADVSAASFATWSHRNPFERSAILRRWHTLIAEHRSELAELIAAEVGKPITQARGEVEYATGFVSWNAEEILRCQGELLASPSNDQRLMVTQQPVGPALGITPWNFPAAMVTRTVAPALAAGCTIVLKPAEQSPLTALALAMLWEEAGGPREAFQVLTCNDPRTPTDVLMGDRRIRKVTFTGSHAVGILLYRRAADTVKAISLELGGHAPFLVFGDADIEAAVAEAVKSKFRYSGQTCLCTNRLYVHERVVDDFTQAYAEQVSGLNVGDPFDEATDIGPLIDEQGHAKVVRHVSDATTQGASALVGGRAGTGLYFEPTVLTGVKDSMAVMQEETFGPVAPILSFRTEEEAVRRANATPFGLAAYFWTRDVGRVFRLADQLEAGIVGANDGVPGGSAHVPFGGVKESGVGRAGGRWGLEEFLEPKYMSLRLPSSADS